MRILPPPCQFRLLDPAHAGAASARRRKDPAASANELDAWARHARAANGFGDAAIGRTDSDARPSSASLYAGARIHRAAAIADGFASAWSATLGTVRSTFAAWRRQRLARATYRALLDLDRRTLRDLGLDRSEIGSIAAELSGAVGATRIRVLEAHLD
jgi:uncharacterized protein YjiS (DUF1127 family)